MEEEKKYFGINLNKLMHTDPKELDPTDIAMIIVIAGFHRPVTEEEVVAKMAELGLDKMSDEEIIVWIDDWKRKRIPEMLN